MRTIDSYLMFALLLTAVCLLPSCGGGKPAGGTAGSGDQLVVVYSSHGADIQNDVKQAFEAAHPGYVVQFLDMGAAKIIEKIRAEKDRPRCDVWWGGSPNDFRAAATEGLLEPYTPEWSANLPAHAKAADGAWQGMWLTPEVIMFNEDKIKKEDVPRTWDGLLDEKWKGRVVIRDVRPSGTMKTIFGALIWRAWKKTGQVDDGFAFLEKLHAQTGAYAANPTVLYELLQSEKPYALTPWNMPDAYLQKNIHKRPFGFVIPEDAPVLVEPIALVKGSRSPEAAKVFYDFVTSKEQLLHQAKKFDRLPARTDLDRAALPEWMQTLELKPLDLDWGELQAHEEEWIARWYSEVKAK